MAESVRRPRRWPWIVACVVLPVAGFLLGAFVMFADFRHEFQMPCPPVFSPKPGEIDAPRGAGFFPPRALARPASMPMTGRLARVEGTVLLVARVEADGSVSRTELLRTSGFCPYDVQALADVRRWKFRPAHRGMGEAFAVWLPVRIVYRRDQRPRFEPQKFPLRAGENI